MAELNLGQDFTEDETLGSPMPVVTGQPGVKEAAEEVVEEEIPSASPAEKEPSEGGETPGADDAGSLTEEQKEELARSIQGLEKEKARLLVDVSSLKGERRQLKQADIQQVQSEIDELKDYDPADVVAIERIMQVKGYLTKQEAETLRYEDKKQSAIDKFLSKYPEYKKENDPNDVRWGAIEREMEDYRRPSDPSKVYSLLERAHKFLSETTPTSDPSRPAQKQRVEIASMGGGGVQRSSSQKSLPDHLKQYYRDGGWSEEEITEIEKNYQE